MAHIAIITTGLTGILNASFELMKRIEALGHVVTCLCPIDVAEKVQSQGFKYIQLPELHFHISDKKQLRQAELNLAEYENILKNLSPDQALIDEELHELIFISLKLQIEVKLLSQFFCHQRVIGLPPLRSTVIPNQSIGGSSLGIQLAWLYIKLKVFRRLWLNKFRRKSFRRSLLLKLAKNSGLSRQGLAARNFPSVFIHTKLPVLSMTLEELEFPYTPPGNLNYIGPMVNDGRRFKSMDDPGVLAPVLELSKKDPGKKLIYCSVSSLTMGDQNFIRRVIEAVSLENDWLLVISLGGKLDSSDFKPLPSNVHLYSWVPQLEVLKAADCSINHGGIHTIHECIHFKVPMIVYSGKQHDQNGNAARIAYHGLGLRGDKDKDDNDEIRTKIEHILKKTSYKEKIRKVHTVYEEYQKKDLSSFLV